MESNLMTKNLYVICIDYNQYDNLYFMLTIMRNSLNIKYKINDVKICVHYGKTYIECILNIIYNNDDIYLKLTTMLFNNNINYYPIGLQLHNDNDYKNMLFDSLEKSNKVPSQVNTVNTTEPLINNQITNYNDETSNKRKRISEDIQISDESLNNYIIYNNNLENLLFNKISPDTCNINNLYNVYKNGIIRCINEKVDISKDNFKTIKINGTDVHPALLIALSYIQRPKDYQYLYFKDNNSKNFNVNNLEWKKDKPVKK